MHQNCIIYANERCAASRVCLFDISLPMSIRKGSLTDCLSLYIFISNSAILVALAADLCHLLSILRSSSDLMSSSIRWGTLPSSSSSSNMARIIPSILPSFLILSAISHIMSTPFLCTLKCLTRSTMRGNVPVL